MKCDDRRNERSSIESICLHRQNNGIYWPHKIKSYIMQVAVLSILMPLTVKIGDEQASLTNGQ